MKTNKMKQQIKVSNISCTGCVNTIKNGLKKVEGVEEVQVDQNSQTVTVEGEVQKEVLTARLSELGYPEKK